MHNSSYDKGLSREVHQWKEPFCQWTKVSHKVIPSNTKKKNQHAGIPQTETRMGEKAGSNTCGKDKSEVKVDLDPSPVNLQSCSLSSQSQQGTCNEPLMKRLASCRTTKAHLAERLFSGSIRGNIGPFSHWACMWIHIPMAFALLLALLAAIILPTFSPKGCLIHPGNTDQVAHDQWLPSATGAQEIRQWQCCRIRTLEQKGAPFHPAESHSKTSWSKKQSGWREGIYIC